jgi:hypothetical protein
LIQVIRASRDRLYTAVDPHFTFVFPTEKLSAEALADHTESVIQGCSKIGFVLTKALVVKDDPNSSWHAFLIPSIGAAEVTTLHDLLYTDTLASELRPDIPYIPHIGIAANQDSVVVEELVDNLNAKPINIVGVIEALTVSTFDGIRVKDTKRLSLA